MKEYKSPEYHFVRNPGGLSGSELAKLSDDELSRYLSGDSYQREKKKYRIKSGYILREIAGEYAIVPAGAESDSPLENTVMAPNGSAVFIWKHFEEPSTLEDVVVQGMLEYDVTEDRMRR
ncbi:MAG: PqqD family protein, partial [Candidatus Faecousia sp.]|nr:PqqD family protein [Candidatus Faecousia sp.]